MKSVYEIARSGIGIHIGLDRSHLPVWRRRALEPVEIANLGKPILTGWRECPILRGVRKREPVAVLDHREVENEQGEKRVCRVVETELTAPGDDDRVSDTMRQDASVHLSHHHDTAIDVREVNAFLGLVSIRKRKYVSTQHNDGGLDVV